MNLYRMVEFVLRIYRQSALSLESAIKYW